MRRARAWLAALAVVGALALIGLAIVHWASPRAHLYRPPDDAIAIPQDASSIARGRHLVEAVAVCTVCHGDRLGGKLAFEDRFLGRGYTANLTRGRGGIGQRYGTADWVRAIRYGVRPDGHGILFMPSDYYNAITDADLGAIVAYLQSLPPVDNERTEVELTAIARFMIDLGMAGEVVRAARIDYAAPRRANWPDPGAYLVRLGGCTFCHGAQLQGGQGPEPGAPGGPDLTSRGPLAGWSLADFSRALRSGVAPGGHAIEPKYMPWMGYRHLSDDELATLWRYLQTLPQAPPH